MVTINVTLLLEIATGIGIIGGAFVWIKKLLAPFTEPMKEIERKQKKLEKEQGEFEERLTELENTMKELQESSALTVKSVYFVLVHLLTGNHTKEMTDLLNDLRKYVFDI